MLNFTTKITGSQNTFVKQHSRYNTNSITNALRPRFQLSAYKSSSALVTPTFTFDFHLHTPPQATHSPRHSQSRYSFIGQTRGSQHTIKELTQQSFSFVTQTRRTQHSTDQRVTCIQSIRQAMANEKPTTHSPQFLAAPAAMNNPSNNRQSKPYISNDQLLDLAGQAPGNQQYGAPNFLHVDDQPFDIPGFDFNDHAYNNEYAPQQRSSDEVSPTDHTNHDHNAAGHGPSQVAPLNTFDFDGAPDGNNDYSLDFLLGAGADENTTINPVDGAQDANALIDPALLADQQAQLTAHAQLQTMNGTPVQTPFMYNPASHLAPTVQPSVRYSSPAPMNAPHLPTNHAQSQTSLLGNLKSNYVAKNSGPTNTNNPSATSHAAPRDAPTPTTASKRSKSQQDRATKAMPASNFGTPIMLPGQLPSTASVPSMTPQQPSSAAAAPPAQKPKRKPAKKSNTQQRIMVSDDSLLVHNDVDAKRVAIARVPLQVTQDDRNAVANNYQLLIPLIAKAFDADFQAQPDTTSKHADDGREQWANWQKQSDDKVQALLAEKPEPKTFVQACARLFLSCVLEAHEVGKGPVDVPHSVAAGGPNTTLSCSNRVRAAIKILERFPIVRHDFLRCEHHAEFAANPDGYADRKITNLWTNRGRASNGRQPKRGMKKDPTVGASSSPLSDNQEAQLGDQTPEGNTPGAGMGGMMSNGAASMMPQMPLQPNSTIPNTESASQAMANPPMMMPPPGYPSSTDVDTMQQAMPPLYGRPVPGSRLASMHSANSSILPRNILGINVSDNGTAEVMMAGKSAGKKRKVDEVDDLEDGRDEKRRG